MIWPIAGRGRPRRRHVPDILSIAAEDMLADAPWQNISWRTGTKGKLKARFAAIRVRIADGPPQRIGTRASNICPGENIAPPSAPETLCSKIAPHTESAPSEPPSIEIAPPLPPSPTSPPSASHVLAHVLAPEPVAWLCEKVTVGEREIAVQAADRAAVRGRVAEEMAPHDRDVERADGVDPAAGDVRSEGRRLAVLEGDVDDVEDAVADQDRRPAAVRAGALRARRRSAGDRRCPSTWPT